MNDKDKEAYEKYLIQNNVNQRQIWNELSLDEIWQAACEYKHKEIEDIISFQNTELIELNKKISMQDDEYVKDIDYLDAKIRKLQAELEQERAKSQRMVEALKIVGWHCSDDGSHDPDEMWDVIEKALAEYKKEG